MTLELPADAEPFIPDGSDLSDLRNPAVYALVLTRPDNLAEKWDRVYDTRPDYFDDLQAADQVVYVGASADLLGRLEDHRDSKVRVAALMRACDIESLRNVWWFDSADKAFERENGIAMLMQNEYPDSYVHSR